MTTLTWILLGVIAVLLFALIKTYSDLGAVLFEHDRLREKCRKLYNKMWEYEKELNKYRNNEPK